MRTSYMEIDLSSFKYNIEKIKEYVGQDIEIMPVIKANGYGTYINEKVELFQEFNIVSVAMANEGEALRKLGYKQDIFILNQPDILDIDCILKNKLTIGLSDFKFLEKICEIEDKIKIHLEIETGMGRTGIALDNLDEYIQKIKENKNIELEGVYTHFSVADVDKDYTNLQIKKFKLAINKLQMHFGKIKYIHAAASNGILNHENAKFNTVRPGIIIYGYESYKGAYDKLKLKPIAKLKTNINFIKDVKKGESISYGRTFIADKDLKVATISLGYADGIRRCLSNNGEVVINGQKAKIIGTICMDSFMVDVTLIPNVQVGNEVYIWDNEIITLDEISEKCNTINYEILSTISNRVPRKFIK